jgi:hypothetical protein
MQLVRLPPGLLTRLNAQRASTFPALAEEQAWGMLLPDLTLPRLPATGLVPGRVWVVELKPKWSAAPALQPGGAGTACRNCMYAAFKLARRQWAPPTLEAAPRQVAESPCLLRLHAPEERVVQACVDALLRSGWAKLFGNGVAQPPAPGTGETLPVECGYVAAALQQSRILELLAHHQAALDRPLAAAHAEYLASSSDRSGSGMSSPPSSPDLAAFLLSATLKDVSVLVAVSGERISAHWLPPRAGATQGCWYTVHVVDVDRKSAHKLPYYWARQQEVEAFWRAHARASSSSTSTSASSCCYAPKLLLQKGQQRLPGHAGPPAPRTGPRPTPAPAGA